MSARVVLALCLVLGFMGGFLVGQDNAEPADVHVLGLSATYDSSLDQRTKSSAPAVGSNAAPGGKLTFRFASRDDAAILAERGELGDVPAADPVQSGALVNTTSIERKAVTLDANGTAMLRLDSNNDWVMVLRFTSIDVWRPPPPGVCDEDQSLYFATPMFHFVPVREVFLAKHVTVPFGAVCTGP